MMGGSQLQELFLRDIAASFAATRARILRRLSDSPTGDTASIIEDELRGLYHGLFVILDGGSALADHGLVHVVDDEGQTFDRFLHEICLQFWQTDSPAA